MAHQNEELIRRGYAAFASGDMDTLRQLFAPDIVWHSGGRNLLSGEYRGIDQVLQFFGRLFELSEGSFKIELHDVLANDEHAVAVINTRASRGGRQMETKDTHVFNMRDGRATEFWALSFDPYVVDEVFAR